MQTILGETATVKTDIEKELDRAAKDVTDVVDKTDTDADNALIAGTAGGLWGGVCNDLESHKNCRGDEKTDCETRDTECNEMNDVQDRCLADNPLCNCDDATNSAETVKECLEKARAWHNNFHIDYSQGGLQLSIEKGETRANLDV